MTLKDVEWLRRCLARQGRSLAFQAACMASINEGPAASMDDVAKSQALALTAQMQSSAGIAPRVAPQS